MKNFILFSAISCVNLHLNSVVVIDEKSNPNYDKLTMHSTLESFNSYSDHGRSILLDNYNNEYINNEYHKLFPALLNLSKNKNIKSSSKFLESLGLSVYSSAKSKKYGMKLFFGIKNKEGKYNYKEKEIDVFYDRYNIEVPNSEIEAKYGDYSSTDEEEFTVHDHLFANIGKILILGKDANQLSKLIKKHILCLFQYEYACLQDGDVNVVVYNYPDNIFDGNFGFSMRSNVNYYYSDLDKTKLDSFLKNVIIKSTNQNNESFSMLKVKHGDKNNEEDVQWISKEEFIDSLIDEEEIKYNKKPYVAKADVTYEEEVCGEYEEARLCYNASFNHVGDVFKRKNYTLEEFIKAVIQKNNLDAQVIFPMKSYVGDLCEEKKDKLTHDELLLIKLDEIAEYNAKSNAKSNEKHEQLMNELHEVNKSLNYIINIKRMLKEIMDKYCIDSYGEDKSYESSDNDSNRSAGEYCPG